MPSMVSPARSSCAVRYSRAARNASPAFTLLALLSALVAGWRGRAGRIAQRDALALARPRFENHHPGTRCAQLDRHLVEAAAGAGNIDQLLSGPLEHRLTRLRQRLRLVQD